MLRVTQGDVRTGMIVHHPRTYYRYPCGSCLSIKHGTKDCTTENKDESIARFTKDVEIPASTAAPMLSKVKTLAHLKEQNSIMRLKWAPALQQRLERSRRKTPSRRGRGSEGTRGGSGDGGS
jgi:hypothetical protein